MTLLFAAGALSMLVQVVVLREIVAALYGVELLYVMALGSWLVGTAAGAAAGRRVPARVFAGVAGCVALGVLVPAEVAAIRLAGPLAGAVAGAYLPFPVQLGWIAAVTIPPAAVCGVLFPVLAGLASASDGSVGRSYAVESAGAAAGGAGVTLALGLGASTFQLAVVAPALGVGAAIAAAAPWPRRRRFGLALLIAFAATLGAARARPWDLALLRHMYPALVDAADTPYGRVAIVRRESQTAVFENGALAFDTEGVSAEAFADLAAAQHPQPRRALVIGGGGEGVPDALGRHGIPLIHDLEVDRRAFGLVRARTVSRTAAAGEGPVSVIFEEPRRFLERAGTYDLMLVATGEPTSGAASRFYTREFFAQCARCLTSGGVLAIRLAAAENVWPWPLARRTASILAALRREFGSVELVAGATLYLFASDTPLSDDPAVLAGRLSSRGVRPRLITPPYLEYLYTNDRRDEVARLLERTPVDGPNRDAAPVCYQYAAMMWLSKFFPSLAAARGGDPPRREWAIWIGVLAAGAAAVAWARRGHNRRLAVCLVVVGFVGMVLETVLLLRYQIRHGVVYQQVGWLLTCFMAGMMGGACAADGAGRAGRAGRAALWAAVFGCTLGAWGAIAWLPSTSGLWGTSVLLAASGAAVGVAFAAAAGQWQGGSRGAASALYAADVAGGAAAAMLAPLVLVPAAGLDASALYMVALAASLLLVIPRSGPGGR